MHNNFTFIAVDLVISDHIEGVLKDIAGTQEKDKFVEMIKKYEEM